MKKVSTLLLTSFALIGLTLYWAQDPEMIKKSTTRPEISRPFEYSIQAANKTKNPIQNFEQEFQKAAMGLVSKIEELKVDPDELDRIVSRHGPKALDHVPKQLRSYYLEVNKAVDQIRNKIKSDHGMTDHFFTSYQVHMPQRLKQEHRRLQQVSLPEEALGLARQDHLSDEDVSFLLNKCGKKNTDCINRSFVTLIDANHLLSDRQLSLIKEYL